MASKKRKICKKCKGAHPCICDVIFGSAMSIGMNLDYAPLPKKREVRG